MSGAIEKWRGGELWRRWEERKDIIQRRQTEERPLPVLRRPEARRVPVSGGSGSISPALREVRPGDPIDLVRRCALHRGEFWMARYIWKDGLYQYSQAILPENTHVCQYERENERILPPFTRGKECCALCGSRPPGGEVGPIRCRRCNSLICWGRTVDSYCYCWCGSEGQLQRQEFGDIGVTPGRGGRNFVR